jgi:hypothetical protein
MTTDGEETMTELLEFRKFTKGAYKDMGISTPCFAKTITHQIIHMREVVKA